MLLMTLRTTSKAFDAKHRRGEFFTRKITARALCLARLFVVVRRQFGLST